MSLVMANPRRSPPHAAVRLAVRLGLALALALASTVALPPGVRPALAVAGAVTLVVDRADDAAGLLCTVGNPSDCTLRSAVIKANTDGVDNIISFISNYTITLTSPLVLSATGTTIQTFPGQIVKIDANGTGQVFRISAADTTLTGLRMYGSAIATAIVWISDSAERVRIANNLIGDDDPNPLSPCGSSPNSQSGIYISSSANPTATNAVAWIYGNLIRCIPGHGIQIVGSREVVIGADSTGLAGFAQSNFIENNGGDAVHLSPGSNSNVIRNSALQYGGGNGLVIDGGDSNSVYGNFMQINEEHGILLTGGASLNSIGCPLLAGDPHDADLRNVIHNNTGDGIRITGDGTNSNLILCNWIGLNDAGTGATPNDGNGVRIGEGAAFNIIGAGPTTFNVISGNGLTGVLITGSGTRSNLVQGNYIGTNATATGAVGNGLDGVGLVNGTTQNTIGGNSAPTLNIIGGNTAYGVYLSGSGTATNTISYNDIGVSTAGPDDLPLPNNGGGIYLTSNTHHNTLGGAASANYVGYNGGDGVSLISGANANQLLVNLVYANAESGVLLAGAGVSQNVLNGLRAFDNGADGFAERSSATLNTWQQVSIYNNGGLGIDKAATSPSTNTPTVPYPVITWVNVDTGQIQGVASNNATVELYRAAPDPLGFGEGRTYLGTAVANGSGFWNITVAAGLPNCYTAFQTVAGESSEFGKHTCATVFLPQITR